MTVYAGPFLSEYNGNSSFGGKYGTHYLVKNKPDTVKVMWFYGTDGSWYYDNTNVPVEFHITCDTTSEPGKPNQPAERDVNGVTVDIVCLTTPKTHDVVPYPLGYGKIQYMIGKVESDGKGGYICPVTVQTTWPVQEASDKVWKVQHAPTAPTITFNLTYDKTNGKWLHPAANPQIKATHKETPPTDTFTVTYTDGVEDEVIFKDWVTTGLKSGDPTPVLSKAPFRRGYTFTGWQPAVAEKVTETVTYTAQWTPVEPKAPTADDLKKLEMAVQVKCDVDKLQLHKDAYGLLGKYDEDYLVGEPKKVGDNWLCDISYLPDLYVAEFNKAFPNLKHVRNDEKLVPVTLIWAGGSWQVKTQGLVPVTEEYTVTFNAYGGSPTPAQHVKSGEKAVPPADPTRKGFTFAFWYLGENEQTATEYNFDTPSQRTSP